MEGKRKMRVSQDHWRVIVEFAEVHPEIITNKFSDHLLGKQKNKGLWEKLVNKLNGLGLGSRTVEEWKKTIADWKSKTKKKASENKKEFIKTGGGPANTTPLSFVEERLILLMGQTAVYGDHSASERGLKRKTTEISKINEPEPEPELEPEPEVIFDGIVDVVNPFFEDHEYATRLNESFMDEAEANTCQTEQTPIRPKNTNAPTPKQKKKLDLQEMHLEVLGVLKNVERHLEGMNANMKSIASSLEVIAKTLKK